MRAEYQVFLYNKVGLPLRAPLDRFTRLEYVNRVNGRGFVSVEFRLNELPRGTLVEDLAADSRVVVWRKPEGLGDAIDFAGVGRFPELGLAGQEVRTALQGYHYNELLERRIVAYDAGSAEAEKSGAADTVIGEMWDENLGASAAAARQIAGYGFSLGPVAGTGTSIELAFSRANVMDAMLKAHEQSRDTLSTAAYFGFVPTGDGLTARFDVRTGLWGRDRRGEIEFSLEQGAMANPSYLVDRRGELTVVYSGGRGREENRLEGTPQTDAVRLAASPLNRREGFFDGRNYKVAADLEAAAREMLREHDVTRRLAFAVTETDECRYGVHWHLGDLVDGSFAGVTQSYMVAGVRVIVAAEADSATAILEEYDDA